jgi:tetratricopeptide (TPR) repeat protein
MTTPNPNASPSRQELLGQLGEVQAQIAQTPHAFQLVAQRGVLLGMLNRWVAARADLERALRLAPRGHQLKAVIYRMCGMANRILGQLPTALAELDRALARNPDASTRSERAEVLRAMSRFPEALAEFDASIAEQDSDAFAFLGRGRTRYGLGELDEALRDLNRALALAPNDHVVLVERARIYRQQGRTPHANLDLRQAERLLREQLARDGDDVEALNGLAWLYTATLDDRHTEALALVERLFVALDEAEQRAAYLTTRGWALLRLGHSGEALPLLERAAALSPFDEDIRARLLRAREEDL